MIRNNHYFLQLEKLHKDSPVLELTNSDKIVIFSDLHMGDGRSMDDFHRNSKLFITALEEFYNKNNYILVLNGDVEELHRYQLHKIKVQWKEIYQLFSKFHQDNRLYKIYGNHDSRLFGYKESEIGFPMQHSLTLKFDKKDIFIYHGHQASFYYNTFDEIMSLALKFVAVPLRIRNYSVAHNNMKKSHVEKMAYEYARDKQIVSIIGHTHRPLFESFSKLDSLKFRIESRLREYQTAPPGEKAELEKLILECREEIREHRIEGGREHSISSLYSDDIVIPCVFNSGSVIGKRGMTSIEIADGNIYLVHWYDRNIKRKYLAEDRKYIREIEGTGISRHIIKHDSLDYIFNRIKMLS